MSKEIPLQKELFTNALVDTRSAYRKRQDRQRTQAQQMAMFTARETVQHGVNPRPWLKDLAAPTMVLEIQDARTEEEKERDWWREAHQQIVPMFDSTEESNGHTPTDDKPSSKTASMATRVVYTVADLRQIGFRAHARRSSIPVRGRGRSQSA